MAAPLAWLAVNPKTALSIGSILAKLGQGFFAGRDMDKAQREQDRRVGYSNLINTFGGRSTPSPVELKPGRATSLLGGLGTALGAGATLYDLADAKRLRDLQTRAAEQTIAAGDRAAGIAQGKANYAADVQRRADAARLLAPPAAGGTGPSLGQCPGFGGAISDADKLLGKATTGAPISQQAVNPFEALGRSQAAQEAGEKALANRLTQAKIQYYGDQGQADITNAYAKFMQQYKALSNADFKRIEDSVNLATPIVENAAATNRSWQEVPSSPLMADIDIRSSEVLKAVFENSRREMAATQNKNLSDFLYGDLASKFNSDQLIKKSGDLIFGMNLMANGFNRQNGVGDLMMVNAMVRLSDPGVSVRPMEALQMEEVGGKLSQWGVIASGEKFLEGDKFDSTVRQRLLTAASELYNGQLNLVNEKVAKEITAATPRVLDLTGRADPGQVNPGMSMFRDFTGTYTLPPIHSYGINDKFLSFTGPQQTPINYSGLRKRF